MVAEFLKAIRVQIWKKKKKRHDKIFKKNDKQDNKDTNCSGCFSSEGMSSGTCSRDVQKYDPLEFVLVLTPESYII